MMWIRRGGPSAAPPVGRSLYYGKGKTNRITKRKRQKARASFNDSYCYSNIYNYGIAVFARIILELYG